jgi:multidrug efflux pump subunit AcrA (membrane-fusion protein)
MNEPLPGEARTLRELVTVLQLERLVRQSATVDEMAFRIVNDTRRAVSCEQAILWQLDALGRLRAQAASGVSQVDADAPQLQQLGAILAAVAVGEGTQPLDLVTGEDAERTASQLVALGYAQALWCPFREPGGALIGGLFLARATPWSEAERLRLDFLAGTYAHALFHLRRHTRSWSVRRERALAALTGKRPRAILFALACLALLLPVRQSAVAPAEVVAIRPFILSPPVDGVIATIDVQPNTAVSEGQLLFTLDDRLIRNRNAVARKALEVARADQARAAGKAFSDPQSKAELAVLGAVVEQRAAEVQYTDELLARIQVRAPRAGVVLFSDASDWLGRPVSVGERIMTLADEGATELLVWLPVDEAIGLREGTEVEAFLNIDPTTTLAARVRLASYTAAPSPQDVLSYPLRATFETGAPRIGLKATAKVYGERVPFVYSLLRRPLSALRRQLGW